MTNLSSPFLLSIFTLLTLSSSITIPLSPITKTPSTNPSQRLNHLATSSLTRARHLKNPHHHQHHTQKQPTNSLTKSPLSPQSYGGYSLSLNFGTPSQTLQFIMDTGSSLVWFPCTARYICSKCNFGNAANPSPIAAFLPKSSSSVKIIGCKNPKCGWIFGSGVKSQCQECDRNGVVQKNCTQVCPPYAIQYGSGTTSGILVSETLNFPGVAVKDFLAGCSVFSTRQPSGIAGFGRGSESLPVQMGLRRFSYCLVSHKFDDEPVSSDMVLETGPGTGDEKTAGLVYTPFLNNTAATNPAFKEYYYVNLRKVTVGGKNVKVPNKFLAPGPDGNGGTIIDSGTTFTFMEGEAFKQVAEEFEKQLAHFSRAADVENESGLMPCFNISGVKSAEFPQLVFHFKGGAKMELPLTDYFSFVNKPGVVCLTIVTDSKVGPEVSGSGPSIILGNYQQQNFRIEYDIENNRLGFQKEICSN